MVSLRKVRMKCLGRKHPEVRMGIKREYFSHLLLDLKVYLDLNDEEFHNLCQIFAERCPINIFQGGQIDNIRDYVIHLQCRSPRKVIAKSIPLSVNISRVQKEASFPFNLNELFVEFADFKVTFLNKETNSSESEVLFASFDYLPETDDNKHYLAEDELEDFEYWLLEILEGSYRTLHFFNFFSWNV